MPISPIRILQTSSVRNYGKIESDLELSDLTRIQTESYDRFLQVDVPPRERKNEGLEAILREVFPIISSNNEGEYRLEYLYYELGKPRYTPTECRQLRLTYGRPFYLWLRLLKEQPVDEVVYLGDMPIMIGGGEFIINGAERVIVSQLHRSPGVDFVLASEPGERKEYSCRIIPERGSWIELAVSKKEGLQVRIDQSGKFSSITLLRAMAEEYSSDEELVEHFYDVEKVKIKKVADAKKLEGRYAAEDVIYPQSHNRAGEIIVDCGLSINAEMAEAIAECGLKQVKIITEVLDHLILNSIQEDATSSHEEALLKIYQRLRPGNPANLERAKEMFHSKFFDLNRYRLGRVGRFRINRKFHQDIPDSEMTLRAEDFVNAMRYLVRLRVADPSAQVDDIDNLGNRRLRTIDELGADEVRKGFLKLQRTVQDKMNQKDVEEMTPRSLINPKSVSATIDYFFGRSELSQVVDQTNPLSMLTHERRLSALGPGGLNRKRAGFDVRDVHISHYGRICPIETPEGTNIGLISSLSMFAKVDDYGFLITPYREVKNGKLTDEVVWLRADEESDVHICPADTPLNGNKLDGDRVLARFRNDVILMKPEDVDFMDIAASQMVGVSAGLIPFLEHDDANRALMGSNMQRQAVPLLITEPPVVGTGMERAVAENSGMLVRAERAGKVTYVDANEVHVDGKRYPLRKFTGLNERTCLNQKPIVDLGQKVKKGQVLCDGAATRDGRLALGRNVLVAFMSWEGYNFEDAIILSERLVKDDVYTSIHIEEFDVEIRDTKMGRPEEFTRDIPNVGDKALRNLDDDGIVNVGTRVAPGDILVGKVSPKAKAELTPEEKLLHAIFGKAGEDVKDESLKVQSGVEGIVIHTEKFSRKTALSDLEQKTFNEQIAKAEKAANTAITEVFRVFLKEFESALGSPLLTEQGEKVRNLNNEKEEAEQARNFLSNFEKMEIGSPQKLNACRKTIKQHWGPVEEVLDEHGQILNSMNRGEELPNGVLQMVKVYIASKRQISVGDKMAGRHGNKGVISKILPEEEYALSRRWNASRYYSESSRCTQSDECGTDSRNPFGLGCGHSWFSGRNTCLRWCIGSGNYRSP